MLAKNARGARGYDAMPWCPRCAVGLSQMEMHEGYQLVAHRSVFVKFPLRGRPGENLLVWTTTPWTLTSNVAAAVHPELTYLKVRHRDQLYYLAKGALTAHQLACQIYSPDKGKPSASEVEKARRRLDQLVEKGLAHKIANGGGRGNTSGYVAAFSGTGEIAS